MLYIMAEVGERRWEREFGDRCWRDGVGKMHLMVSIVRFSYF
jgi:hypothetical protein